MMPLPPAPHRTVRAEAQYTDFADYTELHGFLFWNHRMIRLPKPAERRKPFEGKHAELSEQIIRVFYQVHTQLGYGFSEKVYQNAFAVALREAGMKVEEQIPIKVYFRRRLIGEFFADILVDEVILLELKAVDSIMEEHEAQLLNYLKATEIEVGYVMNFGNSAFFKRKIFDNENKGALRWRRN